MVCLMHWQLCLCQWPHASLSLHLCTLQPQVSKRQLHWQNFVCTPLDPSALIFNLPNSLPKVHPKHSKKLGKNWRNQINMNYGRYLYYG